MIHKAILFASLLGILAFHPGMTSMSNAAQKGQAEPGPTDKDAPTEFTTTKSGLKYRILRKSKGEKPAGNDTVKVNYKGWLDNGKEFDSSYGNEPIEFGLKQVIKGWTEGMQYVGTGGMIELEIPYELGYGEDGSPPTIPPKSNLHFIVELLKVKKGPKPVEPGPTDANAPQEFTETDSGLKYRVLRKSEGKKPKKTDTVSAHYKGWLDDGTVFDSSYDRGAPINIPLNRVIPGWTEGMQLIGEGGMIELEIPYKLGYGENGNQGIPPKATLHFIVELLAPPKPLEPGKKDADAPEKFTTTKSGLKYRILRKSDGRKPAATDKVTVHYKGWLDNGSVFDSSYARSQTTSFPLNGVIKGWTEGLQLVGEGGMIELEIPYDLAYGAAGRPPKIPAKATLHFIVELFEID